MSNGQEEASLADPQRIPEDLAADPANFWRPAADWAALQPPPPRQLPSALERLGASPFPRSSFRFLSFLATVYDHVATHAETPPGHR